PTVDRCWGNQWSTTVDTTSGVRGGTRMDQRTCRRQALMSIRPPYAAAILDGTKLVEFRKRRLASDIDTVVIYMTSPVMAVVGHFTVTEQVTGSPSELWARFEEVAGIDADAY